MTDRHSDLLRSLWMEAGLRRVLEICRTLDVHVLLLKGAALAYWLYPKAEQRMCGDVDLLVPSFEEATRLAAHLRMHEKATVVAPWGKGAHELLCLVPVAGHELEVDIHWGLLNAPVFANAFEFEELWCHSMPIERLGGGARGLTPDYALLHACLHWGMNEMISVESAAVWHGDAALLVQWLGSSSRKSFVSLAAGKGFAGLCAVALSSVDRHNQTTAGGDSEIPLWIAALREGSSTDCMDFARIHDWLYVQKISWTAWPSRKDRWRWLWGRLFPSLDYLRTLYGRPDAGRSALLVHRCKRALARLMR